MLSIHQPLKITGPTSPPISWLLLLSFLNTAVSQSLPNAALSMNKWSPQTTAFVSTSIEYGRLILILNGHQRVYCISLTHYFENLPFSIELSFEKISKNLLKRKKKWRECKRKKSWNKKKLYVEKHDKILDNYVSKKVKRVKGIFYIMDFILSFVLHFFFCVWVEGFLVFVCLFFVVFFCFVFWGFFFFFAFFMFYYRLFFFLFYLFLFYQFFFFFFFFFAFF